MGLRFSAFCTHPWGRESTRDYPERGRQKRDIGKFIPYTEAFISISVRIKSCNSRESLTRKGDKCAHSGRARPD